MARSLKARITPSVLVWARETAGFTTDEVARRLSKTFNPERLLAWETGEDRPTINQLRKLSAIYCRPLAVFYLPAPPRDFPVPHDFRRLPDVGLPTYSSRVRFELRLAQERRQTALQLFDELEEQPPTFSLRAHLREPVEAVASRAREALGISISEQVRWKDPYAALRRWRSAIEQLGVLVFQVSHIDPNEMRGFCIASELLPIIAVNRSARESPRARAFSLMHELTHLMLHISSACDFDEETPRALADLKTEAFCNRVAAEILVPRADFLGQPEITAHSLRQTDWSEADIADLAKRYSVSRELIVRSLLTYGLTSEVFYRRKREEYRRQYTEWKEAQDGGFENPGEKQVRLLGTAFTRLVLESYYNGRMTLSEALGHLGTKVKHLPTIEQALGAA